jgi:hypothetical protein
MEKPKLIEALEIFSPSDWKKFKNFISDKFYSTSEICIIINEIHKQEGAVSLIKIKKKYFYNITDKSFSSILSKIYAQFLEFIAIQELLADQDKYELLVYKTLIKKGLFKHANSIYAKIKARSIGSISSNDNYHSMMKEVNHINYYQGNPLFNENANKVIQDSVHHFLHDVSIKSSIYLTELKNLEILNANNPERSNHTVIDDLKKLKVLLPQNELSKVMTNVDKLFESQDVSLFYSLKDFLFNGGLDKNSEVFDLLSKYLAVLSRRMYLNGSLKEKESIVEIHQNNIESEINMNNGKMNIIAFHNLINILAYMLSYDESRAIVEKCLPKVSTKHINVARDLALAQCCLKHKKFDDILVLTNHTSFDSPLQRLRAVALNSIAMYELRRDSYDLLNTTLNNSIRSLKRLKKNLTINEYNGYHNLFLIINKLIHKDFGKATINLNEYSIISYRLWVEEKISKSEDLLI